MSVVYIACIVTTIAIVVSTVAFPYVLRFAKNHNIVDNPNARKLQRVPIPVMGGVAVYSGVLAGGIALAFFGYTPMFLWGFIAMTIMLVIGAWDDVKDLSAVLRFGIEIALVCALIWLTGTYIDSFHGLFGVWGIPKWVAILLSVVAGVGIINAVNLIDGVDGYSSGYGTVACFCFAALFFSVGKPIAACLALICAGALIPFFMHNVFGLKSKMFIGDGGTLMLGMLMTMFVFSALSSKGECAALAKDGCSIIAFCLAVLSIPVFDTLRVMGSRILKGRSPFSPDKTHLHHLFIDMGFSHIGAAMSIITIMVFIVLCWFASWKLGASITWQTVIVVILSFCSTFGFYSFMKRQQVGGEVDAEGYPGSTKIWNWFCKVGNYTHRENRESWHRITKFIDGSFWGG